MLGATVLIAAASLILCTMRRTLSSRKAMNKRMYDDDETSPDAMRLNQMPFFPPGTAPIDSNSGDREVLIYDSEAKTSTLLESLNTNDDDDVDDGDEGSSLTRGNSGGIGHAVSDFDANNTAVPPPQQRYDQYGRPLNPQQQQEEYARHNQQRPRQPPQQPSYGPGPNAGPGIFDRRPTQPYSGNPYGNPNQQKPPPNGYYPRDRLPRGAPRGMQRRGPPLQQHQGDRPPFAVVMPLTGSGTPAAQDSFAGHMDSFATARTSVDGSEIDAPSGIPVAGDPVGPQQRPLAGPLEVPTAGTPVNGGGTSRDTVGDVIAAYSAETGEGEYVPARQGWRANAAGEGEGQQQQRPRRHDNAEYYDDMDPQYANDPTGAAYAQTVSPVSLPSGRSPYDEFRPPQGYFNQQQQQRRTPNPRVAMGPVSPGGGMQQPYTSRPVYPAEYAYAPPPAPQSPDGSISSQFTSVSQRGVNPRYYTGGPTAPPQLQQSLQGPLLQPGRELTPAQQAKRDRTEMMLQGNPDFAIAGVGAQSRRLGGGPKLALAPSLTSRAKDSPYAPASGPRN